MSKLIKNYQNLLLAGGGYCIIYTLQNIRKRDYAEEGFNGRTKRADHKARTEDN